MVYPFWISERNAVIDLVLGQLCWYLYQPSLYDPLPSIHIQIIQITSPDCRCFISLHMCRLMCMWFYVNFLYMWLLCGFHVIRSIILDTVVVYLTFICPPSCVAVHGSVPMLSCPTSLWRYDCYEIYKLQGRSFWIWSWIFWIHLYISVEDVCDRGRGFCGSFYILVWKMCDRCVVCYTLVWKLCVWLLCG